jgi:2-haloacid dehalogenase
VSGSRGRKDVPVARDGTEPPDTVVFDLGNVLVRWDPYRPFLGVLTRDEVVEFFEAIDFPAFNREQDAGRTWAQAREAVAAVLPHRAWLVDHYVEHFDLSLPGPVPGSAEIVAALRDAGVRLLGLTNWSSETFHHAVPAAPAIGLLEDVLVSGDVGAAKPDPAIFELLVRRYGLEPAATVFVDDAPVNVRAARRCGLLAVHFTDAAHLATDLRALGVPLPLTRPARDGSS